AQKELARERDGRRVVRRRRDVPELRAVRDDDPFAKRPGMASLGGHLVKLERPWQDLSGLFNPKRELIALASVEQVVGRRMMNLELDRVELPALLVRVRVQAEGDQIDAQSRVGLDVRRDRAGVEFARERDRGGRALTNTIGNRRVAAGYSRVIRRRERVPLLAHHLEGGVGFEQVRLREVELQPAIERRPPRVCTGFTSAAE